MKVIAFILFTTMFFTSCKKSDDNLSLFGRWKVEGFVANSTSTAQTATDGIFFTFKNTKEMEIELEINSCSGTFSVEQSKMEIQSVGCTETCCDSGFSQKLISFLPLVETYYFTNGNLNLAGPDYLNIRFTKED